jgi:hypothetical protein
VQPLWWRREQPVKPDALEPGIFYDRDHFLTPCRAYFTDSFFDQRECSDFYSLITGVSYDSALFGPAQFSHALITHGVLEAIPRLAAALLRLATDNRSESSSTKNPSGSFYQFPST